MPRERRQHVADATELLGDVRRRSIRDLIAEKIALLVSSGVLSLGDELPGERELAASLSVSRETVRGAIGILSAHGILRVTHGARTVVASTDTGAVAAHAAMPRIGIQTDLDSVYEARMLIERHLVRAAATHVTDGILARLRTSLHAQNDCQDDAVRFLLCDREFHGLVYFAGGNDVLAETAMGLYNHLLDYRRRIVAVSGAIDRSIGDHAAILDALANGDPDAAEDAMLAHTTRIHETTRAFLDARKAAE